MPPSLAHRWALLARRNARTAWTPFVCLALALLTAALGWAALKWSDADRLYGGFLLGGSLGLLGAALITFDCRGFAEALDDRERQIEQLEEELRGRRGGIER